MRIWGKIWRDNHLLMNKVYEDFSEDTRTHKVFNAIEDFAHEFNLQKPIWLDSNIRDFQNHSRTRFRADNFIETIEFDYFEILVIEED